ncbi:carcinoembryonic antigen-related cell adhesion molecule 18-like [Choloepus didactylus]|uniref:carcinoembryonic antigen-related cell adhesion molecule 18-like n=1 Tax=Choloepus didactylus TaxID=27675 RepID=UPI00189E3F7A|nr:carcinoembryonic antigen-related cell adhesion molecule 18-like [Choloepus didactylus]
MGRKTSLLACGTSQAYGQIFISPDSLTGVQGYRATLILENAPVEALEYSWHQGADDKEENTIVSYRRCSKSWHVGPEHWGRENVTQAGNLVIRGTTLNDTGNYTVPVEASNSTQRATGWLKIEEAICYTNITVKWLLNAVQVSSSDRLTISPDGKTLVIRRLSRHDRTLQCVIESVLGIPLKSDLISLNVTYGPDNVQLWTEPRHFKGVLSAEVGSQVEMRCVSSYSIPKPSYRWIHNGSSLSSEAEMTFPSLAWEQMGRYRCIVEKPGTQLIMYADVSIRVRLLILTEVRSGFYLSGPMVVWLIVITLLGGVCLCGILIYSLISHCSNRCLWPWVKGGMLAGVGTHEQAPP